MAYHQTIDYPISNRYPMNGVGKSRIINSFQTNGQECCTRHSFENSTRCATQDLAAGSMGSRAHPLPWSLLRIRLQKHGTRANTWGSKWLHARYSTLITQGPRSSRKSRNSITTTSIAISLDLFGVTVVGLNCAPIVPSSYSAWTL